MPGRHVVILTPEFKDGRFSPPSTRDADDKPMYDKSRSVHQIREEEVVVVWSEGCLQDGAQGRVDEVRKTGSCFLRMSYDDLKALDLSHRDIVHGI